MRRFFYRLREIPAHWRWGGLVMLLVAGLFLTWFFFLRGGGGAGPVVPAPPARPALGKAVTPGDYRQAVGEALADVRAARSAVGDARKKAIERVVGDLEKVEGANVTPLDGGKPAEIDNTLLLQELKRDEPNLEAVEGDLSALSGVLEKAGAANVAGIMAGDEANTALRQVLSDPVFDYTRAETPLEKMARWLAGLTGRADPGDTLWRWLLALVGGIAAGALTFLVSFKIDNKGARIVLSAAMGLLVGVALLVATSGEDKGNVALLQVFPMIAVAGLVVAALAAGLIVAALNRASAPSSVRPVSELAAVLGMSAVEARRKAEESAGMGDYRSAIRYRCLAVLLALDEAGMLTFDRTATNREYLFRAPGDIHEDLQPLLSRFDQVWYGGAQTNAEEWAGYAERAASIEARVASATRARAA